MSVQENQSRIKRTADENGLSKGFALVVTGRETVFSREMPCVSCVSGNQILEPVTNLQMPSECGLNDFPPLQIRGVDSTRRIRVIS